MADEQQRVVVTSFDMPFWELVVFLVKLTIAFIPAGIALIVLGMIAWTVLESLDAIF